MQIKHITAALAVAGSAAASVVQPFPLNNGFPAPSDQALEAIQKEAGGGLPNIAFPTKISDQAALTFKVIGLEEIMEVAFFTELLHNVTNKVPGYEIPHRHRKYIIKTLKRIRAQEELHFLGANGALESAGRKTVGPCTYNFPVDDYDSAIALANLFTDVNVSIAPLAQLLFAEDGGSEQSILVTVVGAIENMESEQLGFFRRSRGRTATAAPFLTQGNNEFFATSLSRLIVPGSCDFPDIDVYPELTILSHPHETAKTLDFEVENEKISESGNSIVYVTGLSLPKTVPITNVKKMGKTTKFSAKFPFETYSGGFAKGLSYVALVKGDKMYTSPVDVAPDTLNLAFLEIS